MYRYKRSELEQSLLFRPFRSFIGSGGFFETDFARFEVFGLLFEGEPTTP